MRRSLTTHALRIAALLATLVATTKASATDDVRPNSTGHSDHVIVGVKGVSTVEQASAHGHSVGLTGYGIAGVAEKTLLHDRLSLEVDFVYTMPGSERSLAIEPMTKLPWHVSRRLEPYAAAGPLLLSVADGHGTHYWLGGGQLVFGTLVWLVELMGLDLDFAFGAARGTGMSMFEASFAIGPVMRN